MSNNILAKIEKATTDVEKNWIITEALLSTLPSSLSEAILGVAVVHWFDESILGVLLEIAPDKVRQLYLNLQRLAFIQTFGQLGYTIHDLTRSGILAHLASGDLERFQIYSQRAYHYFHEIPDSQNQVEAIYHQLVTDHIGGRETLKRQMKEYRRTGNFTAANNLLRNYQELIKLGILDAEDGVELEKQEYWTVEAQAKRGKQEKSPDKAREYLTEAIRVFTDGKGIRDYGQYQSTELRENIDNYRKAYLLKRLDKARSLGDLIRQGAWLNELGDMYVESKELETALQHFNAALAINVKDHKALANRAKIYALTERYENALTDFSYAIELDDQDAFAFAGRSVIYRLMKQYEEALIDLTQAIELDDKYTWAITSRGQVFAEVKRYEEALTDINRAIQLDKTINGTIAGRGIIYLLIGKLDQALEDLTQAIELDSENDEYLSFRGIILLAKGDHDLAAIDLSKAISIASEAYKREPNDWNNGLNLAIYHVTANNFEQANQLYLNALMTPAPKHALIEAIDNLELLLRIFPNHKQAMDWLQKLNEVISRL